MFDKILDSRKIEEVIFNYWQKNDAFAYDEDCGKEPYTIILPPPNITGSLHLGHALCFTLQDILIRYKRMSGFNVLWQPGLDHAGIVTQLLVERELKMQNISKNDLTREEFVDKIWDWKNHSSSKILSQMHDLGCSIDLSRLRFTMDEESNDAVIKTFVQLYVAGLIYKDTRLVNWDPTLQSAVSDLEVVEKEQDGHMYYIKYYLDQSPEFLIVATTRPETLFGDSALAIHPDDERYSNFIGKFVRVPVCDRVIPIICDEYCDPMKGSGVVKITPAHDFNDFEVGKRHDLEQINIFNKKAQLNEMCGVFAGLDRDEARGRLVEFLKSNDLIDKIENIKHVLPYGDRSGVVIEPYLTEQWFLDAPKLAIKAIDVVKSGEIVFVPQNWENTYFEWMNNIKPWCISRQIVWGHQIPAWYGPDGSVFVADSETSALAQAEVFYGKIVELRRDNDVLDTWYSSSLWPFSTLGWQKSSKLMDKHYPNDVLVTGFDIIFFWVARMIMMGLYFTKKPPFSKIYIHALVRDAYGQKMSKSKGNVIDPMDLISEFGTDALRFSMAALSSPGRDICISKERISGYRGFLTKLWNAVRFADMNGCFSAEGDVTKIQLPVNKWIIIKLQELIVTVARNVEIYRFDNYATALYQFLWRDFCDWYLEFAKPFFTEYSEKESSEVKFVIKYVIENFLKLLSPISPFISEYIYMSCFSNSKLLMKDDLPKISNIDKQSSDVLEIIFLQEVIAEIRSIRREINIPVSAILNCHIATSLNKFHIPLIERMARIKLIEKFKSDLNLVVNGQEIALNAGGIDIAAQKIKLTLELEKIKKFIDSIDCKLKNDSFLSKAAPEVVESTKTLLNSNIIRFKKINQILENI